MRRFIVSVIVLWVVIALVACTGAPVVNPDNTIGTEGGEVAVDDPNSPINGTKVVIPAEALAEEEHITLSITYRDELPAETTGSREGTLHGKYVVFETDKTDAFERLIEITLPVDPAMIENGYIPYPKFYDPLRKIFRPLQLLEIAEDNKTLTVTANGFENMVVFYIRESELFQMKERVSTGDKKILNFVPDKDGFSFWNPANFYTPACCYGMSSFAKDNWMYPVSRISLFNLFGNSSEIDAFSLAHKEDKRIDQDSLEIAVYSQQKLLPFFRDFLVNFEKLSNTVFAEINIHAILEELDNNIPVVFLYDHHAVVVYGYEVLNASSIFGPQQIYFNVYDPNHPGEEKTIEWFRFMTNQPYINTVDGEKFIFGGDLSFVKSNFASNYYNEVKKRTKRYTGLFEVISPTMNEDGKYELIGDYHETHYPFTFNLSHICDYPLKTYGLKQIEIWYLNTSHPNNEKQYHFDYFSDFENSKTYEWEITSTNKPREITYYLRCYGDRVLSLAPYFPFSEKELGGGMSLIFYINNRPTIEKGSPLDSTLNITPSSPITLYWRAKDEHTVVSKYRIVKNGVSTEIAANTGFDSEDYQTQTYTYQASNFTVGNNTVQIFAIDSEGAESSVSIVWNIVKSSVDNLTITQHPQSQTKTEGDNVTFNVVASGGTPPYSYQWRKNGTNINGATSQSYTKNNLVVADAGQYSVVVTDSSGVGARQSVTSNNAQLTVNPIATVTITAQSDPAAGGDVRINSGTWGDSKSVTVNSGTQVTMEAAAASGYTFDGWYDGSAKVSSNTSLTVTATANKTYRAKFNTVSTLTITQHPQSQTKTEGDSVTFNVVASGGTSPYSYQWRKDGTNISGATGQSYTKNNLEFADEGQYSVVVKDSSPVQKSVTSNNAVLTVSPSIEQFSITAVSSPTEGGRVRINNGSWSTEVEIYAESGSQVTVEAQAYSGWTFEGWYKYPKYYKVSDASSYEFLVIDEIYLKAKFSKDSVQCTITVESSPTIGGNVKINEGSWGTNQSLAVNVDSDVTLYAQAADGWVLEGWYDSTGKIYPTSPYSFTAKETRSYYARFYQPVSDNMVLVPHGHFQMGNTRNDSDGHSDEEPLQDVYLTYDFWIGKKEVTFDEYDAYCEEKGIAKPNDEGWGRGQRPVINISWGDAIGFCNWLSEKEGLTPAYSRGQYIDKYGKINPECIQLIEGYRLPTEAEWEYAARSGKSSPDYRYAGGNDLSLLGWYEDNSDEKTQEVGLKQPNQSGLYDMSGNVWEFCTDWLNDYYEECDLVNPIGFKFPGRYVAIRGGSFDDSARSCRIAERQMNQYSSNEGGFRIARTADGFENVDVASCFCFADDDEGEVKVNGGMWYDDRTVQTLLGLTVRLEARAESGYRFIGWYSGGDFVSSANPFVFTMQYRSVTFQACFE